MHTYYMVYLFYYAHIKQPTEGANAPIAPPTDTPLTD